MTSPPPHVNTDAEAAVISAVFCAPDVIVKLVPILAPSHFYSHANQEIYRTLLTLHADCRPLDVITVSRELQERRVFERIGGSSYMLQLIEATPAVANVEEHARILIELSRLRAVLAACRHVVACSESSTKPASEFVDYALEVVRDSGVKTYNDETPPVLNATDIMRERPSIRWACPDLVIGPGRPTLIAGYGYSMKTLAIQSMAMAFAAGGRIWGEFRCERGAALHLDYEQGEYATTNRYRRLFIGMGLLPGDLADEALRLLPFPPFYLNEPRAESLFSRLCDGVSVCFIDSLRASMPSVDEIDSRLREHLDCLTKVSEKTGTAFVLVHHAGKGGKDRDSKEVARGTSAIFDACGTVLLLKGTAAFEPVEVSIVKTSASATGRIASVRFFLRARDPENPIQPDGPRGLLLEHMTAEQVDQPQPMEDRARSRNALINQVGDTLLRMLRRHSDVSENTIRAWDLSSWANVKAALETLAAEGRIEREKGRGMAPLYRIAMAGPHDDNETD